MQGRASFSIGIALVWMACPAFPQEKDAPKKAAGTPKAKVEAKKEAADGPKDGSPVDWDAEPQFKTSKGKESFTKAKELFDLEKYRDALPEMKKAKELAKTPGDKTLLDKWVSACEGGIALGNYRAMMEKGMLRRSLFMALDMGERYRNTPVYARYTAFADELRPKVVEVLEDFDAVSDRFSKKFGKEFFGDPAIVYRGAHCLLWSSTKDGKVSQVQLERNIPKKWNSEYVSVVFWVRTEGYPVEIKLIARSPGAAAAGQETPMMETDYSPPAKAGWVRAEVELSLFKKHGTGTLANVEKFMLQIDSRSAFKLYLDDVSLVRKDPSERTTAGETEKEDAKKSAKKPKTTTGKVKQTERKKS